MLNCVHKLIIEILVEENGKKKMTSFNENGSVDNYQLFSNVGNLLIL